MSPNGEGWGGGIVGLSANEYSCAHGAQINFGDLTQYLCYGWKEINIDCESILGSGMEGLWLPAT